VALTRFIDRREFLELAALGSAGVVFASALEGAALAGSRGAQDFFFVQMSDTHWGFEGAANPDARGTLAKAVDAVNRLAHKPDFVVFTGDLTHTTDDPAQRRKRMMEFKRIVAALDVKIVRFMPGEHDAALDAGVAFRELFGPSHYAFDHKGVHFVAIDNVSDPRGLVDAEQLGWLADDLARLDSEAPIVVLAHRPLFDLAPEWDWATRNGGDVLKLLEPYRNVTVFYGHIHQEHHHQTGRITHHAAKSLMFPLPAPGSQAKRAPVPWNPDKPYDGLGFRDVDAAPREARYSIEELPVQGA
jgi:predicted phosphodiesterase